MIYASTKELYAMFLESDWWKLLSRRKRKLAGGKCECCRKNNAMQAHHRFYRDNWFDTKLDDLKALCRGCHELKHGLREHKQESAKAPRPPAANGEITSWVEAMRLRALRQISRSEFVALKKRFWPSGRSRRKKAPRTMNPRAFVPGKYEGLSVNDVAAQVGTTLPEIQGRHGRTYRVHRWGARIQPHT